MADNQTSSSARPTEPTKGTIQLPPVPPGTKAAIREDDRTTIRFKVKVDGTGRRPTAAPASADQAVTQPHPATHQPPSKPSAPAAVGSGEGGRDGQSHEADLDTPTVDRPSGTEAAEPGAQKKLDRPTAPSHPPAGGTAPEAGAGESGLASGARATADRVAQGARTATKAASRLASNFGKLLANPEAWPIIAIAAVGILAVAILVAGLAYLGYAGSGHAGSDPGTPSNAINDRDDILMALAKAGDLASKKKIMATRGKELVAALTKQETNEPDAEKKKIIHRLRVLMEELVSDKPVVVAKYAEGNILTTLYEANDINAKQALAGEQGKNGGRRKEVADGLQKQSDEVEKADTKKAINNFRERMKHLADIVDLLNAQGDSKDAKEKRKKGSEQYADKDTGKDAIQKSWEAYVKVTKPPMLVLQEAWQQYQTVIGQGYPLVTAYKELANRTVGSNVYSVWDVFFSPRNVSQYRTHAGIHCGYDIAAPLGTNVIAGWESTWETEIDFGGGQLGVVTKYQDAETKAWYSITYGHLTPGSTPKKARGDVIHPGDILGTIAINHVDIKWRPLSADGRTSTGGVCTDWGKSPLKNFDSTTGAAK